MVVRGGMGAGLGGVFKDEAVRGGFKGRCGGIRPSKMHTRLACARRNGALRLDMAACRPDYFFV
ncbi:hypothetical protein D3C72_1834690 [compost metagenome]